MIALIQRVTHAQVDVSGECIGKIGKGLLVLLGVERDDDAAEAERLAEKILKYRVFSDADDKMNLNIMQIAGELLIVPQFTLAADTNSGLRPSFSTAAHPTDGERLYETLVAQLKAKYNHIETGQFGANMQVSLCNNGPVTFHLASPNSRYRQ